MWFNSKLLQNLQETNRDATIYDCILNKDIFQEYIHDFINLNVTKENYITLIEICDFLMIDNVDMFIDKIIEVHDYDYSIIYEFEDFYKYNTKRLIPLNRDSLDNAIKLYCIDDKKCFHKYGFTSFWDVSNIINMKFMFRLTSFKGDISNWDVSNVENMNGMFYKSQFNGNISNWDVSNVKEMRCMFSRSEFNKDISNWNISNVENMKCIFYESEFNKDISNWDMSNLQHDISRLYYDKYKTIIIEDL